MLIEKWKIIVVSAISLLLINVFFLGLKPDEFLFLHDELLALNYNDAVSGLFVRHASELNVDNTTILTVTLFDKLYYLVGFLLKFDLQMLQKIFYYIKLFILMLVPYIGFKKFLGTLNNIEKTKTYISDYVLWLVTFVYAFNTYTTIYWHGNAFQFSLLLCYALAPLALYYFKIIIDNPSPRLSTLLKEALLLAAMSFSVYFIAVFLIVLLVYYFSTLITNPRSIKPSLISLAKLAVLSIPLFAIFLPMLQILTFGGGTVNATGGETFTNIQGGLLYQMFMWFSWGIYSDWSPKNIFTFNDYYQSTIYLLSPLAILGTIFFGIKNKLQNKETGYFLVILIITLIFAKGPQPPFQEVFVQLINHFPPFRVFRSPDNKFGFGIILSLSFLLLLVTNGIKKKILVPLLLFIVAVQAFPIFSGIAIRGQNTATSSDRVIHVSEDYKDLADYLKDTGSGTEYLLPIPPTNFGHFIISDTEKHLGQDLIPKIIKNPYITPDEYSSMSVKTYEKIRNSFENNLEGINDFPIEYFLIRNDLEFLTEETNLRLDIQRSMTKVFENNSFTLYRNQEAAKVIEAKYADSINFLAISPVEYKVRLNGITGETTLILNTNFNSDWEVYIANKYTKNTLPFYPNLNHRIVNIPNSLHNGYSNQWVLDKNEILKNYSSDFYEINDDGTINANLIIYYQPQTSFYILALTSVISAVIYVTFIFTRHGK